MTQGRCEQKAKNLVLLGKTLDMTLLTHPRSIFLIHKPGENVEDLLEPSRRVDPMKSLLSTWCCILRENSHFLDERWVELEKVLHGDAGQI